MPTSTPKSVQPAVPDESFADYAEQDVIKAIEAVVRATTKAYGWRRLGDIGSFLSRSHALRE